MKPKISTQSNPNPQHTQTVQAPAQHGVPHLSESRPQVSSVLTIDQVNASSAKLQNQVAGEIRQKRKYTKRGNVVSSGVSQSTAGAPLAPPAPPMPLETIESLLPIPFEAIAEFRNCEAWKLAPEKTKALAVNVQIIMKYISPNTSELSAAITGAVLILGTHAYTSILAEKELAKKREIDQSGIQS